MFLRTQEKLVCPLASQKIDLKGSDHGAQNTCCQLLPLLHHLLSPKYSILALGFSLFLLSSCCRVMGKGKDTRDSTAAISTVPLTKTPSKQYGEDEGEEDRFHNALLELKDLRSQLYHAADYCETAFSTAEQKKMILEGTKSYICEAIVAVVDHLGNVSSKLEQSLLANTADVQTERRIDCLKQRLLTCQQYAVSLELSSMQLSLKFPQHHEHYVSAVTQHIEKWSDLSRPGGSETPTKKDHMAEMAHSLKSCAADHFFPASNQTILGVELAKATPVVKGPSVLLRPRNPSVKFKPEDLYMLGGVYQKKKPMQVNNILSFLRVSKRKT
ncbi:probable protein ABIL5 isoform X2 [Musa acuminata AAA Group]|uniref:probable protein ABIL5 isoform X2 n=1 Tax=Musa acuminata AAA Group TaxID=214697 RepID=UPI0031DBD8BE